MSGAMSGHDPRQAPSRGGGRREAGPGGGTAAGRWDWVWEHGRAPARAAALLLILMLFGIFRFRVYFTASNSTLTSKINCAQRSRCVYVTKTTARTVTNRALSASRAAQRAARGSQLGSSLTHHARKPRTAVAPAHSREQKQCIRVEEMLRVEHRRIYIGSAPCETCSGERPSERKEDSQPSVS